MNQSDLGLYPDICDTQPWAHSTHYLPARVFGFNHRNGSERPKQRRDLLEDYRVTDGIDNKD